MINFLDEVLESNVDILAVAKEIAPNGKVIGNDYTALCPFHSEKNPSYKIGINNGKTHCFGCNHAGDIVKDYAQIKGLTLVETKNEIINKFGNATASTTNRMQIQENNIKQHLNRAINFWNTRTIPHHNGFFAIIPPEGLSI